MKDTEFDDLLRMARGNDPLPASFRPAIWQRINEAELMSRPGQRVVRTFVAACVRPWGAAAGIAAMVTLGLWLGDMTVPNAKDSQVAYAESISPFAHTYHK